MNETEVRSKEQKIEEQLSNAVTILKEEQKSCVILSEDGAVRCSDAIGIKPLMVELRADRKAFQGSVIADKVVGKAAALLAVLGEVQAVFGRVMSEGAVSIFESIRFHINLKPLCRILRTGQRMACVRWKRRYSWWKIQRKRLKH